VGAGRPVDQGAVVTGAGDLWDAGDILGHLMHFNLDDRLHFPNASAYVYVSHSGARLPNLRQLEHVLGRWSRKTAR
jgi:sugar/nucleoside kinase (ribokinase family)